MSGTVSFAPGAYATLVLSAPVQSLMLPCLMPDGGKSLEKLSPQSIPQVLTNDFPRHSKTYYRAKREVASESLSSPMNIESWSRFRNDLDI